jgi:hypothetical protein
MKKPLARPAAWIQAAGRRGLHANQGISSIDALWDAFAPSMAAAPRDARRAITPSREGIHLFLRRIAEPCTCRSVASCMAGYSRDDGRSLARGFAFHLFLYLAAAGGLGFGLYELSQPARSHNPGLAAYKPFPATVITPGWSTNRVASHSPDLTEPIIEAASPTPEPETDGRSTHQPPITEAPVPAHRPPKVARASSRQGRAEPPQRHQQVACIPRYDSSGAQTQAC